MVAASEQNEVERGRRSSDDSELSRPDHLVVWRTGRLDGEGDPFIEDHLLGPDFSVAQWAERTRARHPDAMLGVTFPGGSDDGADGGTGRWMPSLLSAAGDSAQGDGSFTGDTTPASLGALRRWVSRLAAGRTAEPYIVLALSELSTNAERHGGRWLTVDLNEVQPDDADPRGVNLSGDRSELVLTVTDPATRRLPELRIASPDEVSGRGLFVVATIALRWGLILRPAHKSVWASFPGTRRPVAAAQVAS